MIGFTVRRKKIRVITARPASHKERQVVSIRLPTRLLNQLRAKASAEDIPYQALIKILLSRSLRRVASI